MLLSRSDYLSFCFFLPAELILQVKNLKWVDYDFSSIFSSGDATGNKDMEQLLVNSLNYN